MCQYFRVGGIGSAAAPHEPPGVLPRPVIVAVQGCLDDIATEMTEEILRAVPEYSRTSDGTYAANTHKASELTVADFVHRIAGGAFDGTSVGEMFREAGRIEAGLGRDLGTLQTAMHVGVRVMWRRISACLVELDVPAKVLGTVAASLFSHLTANASAASEGHAQGQTRLADQIQLHRHRLVDLLLSVPPPSDEAVAGLARHARWPVPKTVAVVVAPRLNTLELRPDVLPGLHRSEPCLVVPDPEEGDRVGDVERSLHGLPGILGPTVPLAHAAKSLQWSLEMLALRRRGILDGAGLIRTADHLSTLLMFQNEELLAALVGVQLAPLAGLRPPQRERLTETLLVWLETVHDANAAAARLFVHPQTIRYRVRRLEQLFGDRLQDPDARLDLELALRARRLLARARSEESADRAGEKADAPHLGMTPVRKATGIGA
jgi:hypothetical protein